MISTTNVVIILSTAYQQFIRKGEEIFMLLLAAAVKIQTVMKTNIAELGETSS